ncbi:hypothetical protein AAVH_41023 [Aphelenchoides avenae]|nr:hypothetical protein AAVH_41023 [Aphelenchus avenae]
MVQAAVADQGVPWQSVSGIQYIRCGFYSFTTTLRRNNLALEIMRDAEARRDVSHTLMQHAIAKNARLQGEAEKAEADRQLIDEKLEQSVTMLQMAKKCIVDERNKNALLVARIAELEANIDAIGLHLKVEEGVRKQLDHKLAALERAIPRFVAPPPGFENVPRGAFRPSLPPPPRSSPPQPQIGTGRPLRSAVPPPTATPSQPS